MSSADESEEPAENKSQFAQQIEAGDEVHEGNGSQGPVMVGPQSQEAREEENCKPQRSFSLGANRIIKQVDSLTQLIVQKENETKKALEQVCTEKESLGLRIDGLECLIRDYLITSQQNTPRGQSEENNQQHDQQQSTSSPRVPILPSTTSAEHQIAEVILTQVRKEMVKEKQEMLTHVLREQQKLTEAIRGASLQQECSPSPKRQEGHPSVSRMKEEPREERVEQPPRGGMMEGSSKQQEGASRSMPRRNRQGQSTSLEKKYQPADSDIFGYCEESKQSDSSSESEEEEEVQNPQPRPKVEQPKSQEEPPVRRKRTSVKSPEERNPSSPPLSQRLQITCLFFALILSCLMLVFIYLCILGPDLAKKGKPSLWRYVVDQVLKIDGDDDKIRKSSNELNDGDEVAGAVLKKINENENEEKRKKLKNEKVLNCVETASTSSSCHAASPEGETQLLDEPEEGEKQKEVKKVGTKATRVELSPIAQQYPRRKKKVENADGRMIIVNLSEEEQKLEEDARQRGSSPLLCPHGNKECVPASSEENSPCSKELTKKRQDILASLENGVHYFSDYDISKVKVQPEPLLDVKHPKYYFHYMNQSTSKWPFAWVSNKPRIAFVPEFITEEEADGVIQQATARMAPSKVLSLGSHRGEVSVDPVRTSTGTFLDPRHSSLAKRLIARALALVGFPENSTESSWQVLKYTNGQKYDHHWDTVHPLTYGPQTSNRAVTIYFYLSDVEEGGETAFPMADGKVRPSSYSVDEPAMCQIGFRTRPLKRSVAIFYSMTPTGVFDGHSLHGACPVKKGVKWGAPLWLRIPFGGTDD